MPPKIKTSAEKIIYAAFCIARKDGLSAITAQSVSKELGTSVAPIFRVFQSMEELKAAVVSYIERYHIEYLKNYPLKNSEFITYGLAYISFAKEEPHLFDALMHADFLTLDYGEKQVSSQLDFVIESAVNVCHLEKKTAKGAFFHIWFYTHGIACLASRKSIALTEDEIVELLMTAFSSFVQSN